jgi:hypothetical protein
MQALDQEMKRIDGGLGKKAVIKTQDIVIHILGQNPTSRLPGRRPSTANPSSACRRPRFSTRKWSQPTISTSTSG